MRFFVSSCHTAAAQFSELKYQLNPQIELIAMNTATSGSPNRKSRQNA